MVSLCFVRVSSFEVIHFVQAYHSESLRLSAAARLCQKPIQNPHLCRPPHSRTGGELLGILCQSHKRVLPPRVLSITTTTKSHSDSSVLGSNAGGENNWSFLSWYLDVLAAILTLVGDLICQLVIDQAPCLDLKRTFLFTSLGLVLVGPTLHFWYLYLSKLVTLPGSSGAFMSLVLDQFLFSPIFIGVFLSALMTLEGRPSQVVPKIQQEWFSAVLANWQLWIPFQFLNFRFVPQQFQVLAANAVALVWNVILSFKAHKEVLQK